MKRQPHHSNHTRYYSSPSFSSPLFYFLHPFPLILHHSLSLLIATGPHLHVLSSKKRQSRKLKKTDKETLHSTTSSILIPFFHNKPNTKMELESPKTMTASSPEFEFWMVGKNSPKLKHNLHTADELFIDGVLLPLHLLPSPKPNTSPQPNPASVSPTSPVPDSYVNPTSENPTSPVPDSYINPTSESPTSPVPDSYINPTSESPKSGEPDTPAPQSSILSSSNLISSKRWKDIFRKKDQNTPTDAEKRKDRKGNVSNSSASAVELNIKIWPFSRSRSAGTAAVGPKGAAAAAATMRKSNSAPCSRSNSRRSAPSPGMAGMGVYVGRTSPVWQARRIGKGSVKQKGKEGMNLNLNVNSCIGHGGSQVRCGSEDGGGGGGGGLIKFKGLFSKKVT